MYEYDTEESLEASIIHLNKLRYFMYGYCKSCTLTKIRKI